jgi:hypothetical protein
MAKHRVKVERNETSLQVDEVEVDFPLYAEVDCSFEDLGYSVAYKLEYVNRYQGRIYRISFTTYLDAGPEIEIEAPRLCDLSFHTSIFLDGNEFKLRDEAWFMERVRQAHQMLDLFPKEGSET